MMTLAQGSKAWWISKSPGSMGAVEGKTPCQFLGRENNLLNSTTHSFCVQHAGEAVYFPNQHYHGTCNLDRFVFGCGAPGSVFSWHPLTSAAHKGDFQQVLALLAKEDEGGKWQRRICRTHFVPR